jgi:hypothetical protein
MVLSQTIRAFELLDHPHVCGDDIKKALNHSGVHKVEVERVSDKDAFTDFIKVVLPGRNGRLKHGDAPTLGIVGQLGGVGARPSQIGLVSDADGAVVVIAAALKLAQMAFLGDELEGDVVLTTHVCPISPIIPHEPVPFMGSPVSIQTQITHLVDENMQAILSVDTTKGNRILNHNGFAITPTVKEGYILRVSEDLLDIMTWTTGKAPVVLPITTQDITPYGNLVYHLNSIMQPSTLSNVPCVGVAITTESVVPGCATGSSHPMHIESAVRFVIEVAKAYGMGKAQFYDPEEFARLVALYGSMTLLQVKDTGDNREEE